jgi:uncharacterized protein (TIGR02117 family)
MASTAAPPRDVAAATSIYTVSHGGHTGILVRRADVPPGLWPEIRDFPDADTIEVGWGDQNFYRSPDPGLLITLSAAFAPTPSVLHLVGVRGSPLTAFRHSEIVEIRLPRDAVAGLVRYIDAAHLREGGAAAQALGPGLYGDSRFYPGRERFHIGRTCNVWTAGALRAAGLPVRNAVTREGLMKQVRPLGTVLKPVR